MSIRSRELGAVPAPGRSGAREALRTYVLVALAVGIAVWLGARHPLDNPTVVDLTPYTGSRLFGGWFRYDGRWYETIATSGYSFAGPDQQSPVAFFPAYPLVLKAVHAVTALPVRLLGTVVTISCGAGVAVLFHRWCRDRADARTARLALLCLLVYPYAYYLMGAVYADALFLVAALGAFCLLEQDRPVLAGLAGAVATAARPTGLAVVVGLVAVLLWRRGAVEARGARPRLDLGRLRTGDAGVLLSLAGLGSWMLYLGVRFGHPLAFQEVQQAPGWDQGSGPHTWFKLEWFDKVADLPFDLHRWLVDGDVSWYSRSLYTLGIVAQGLLVLGFVALAVRVWRRDGWGYSIYSLALLSIAIVGTKDFQGAGRYVLAAFPCFLALADLLAARPRLLRVALGASAALLLGWSFAYGRGYYVA